LLAAGVGSLDLSPPIDGFPAQDRIFDAIDANDFDLALRVITADPAAVESVDGIPPPVHACIYDDKPEWLEWLLDHGANIERREQDYGSTPLLTAVVHRHKRIIRTLVQRGADATRAMDCAQRGLAGAYEDDPSLDREGYREIVELLRALGIG
jgi:ankyrin repeat protein